MKPTAIYLCQNQGSVANVYAEETQVALPCPRRVYSKEELLASPANFSEVKYIFSTWGMPHMTREEIQRSLPSLEAVFYAAGSVQSFAREFLELGISVHSAWGANAIPVAEYTVAQILLAMKGYFAMSGARSRAERDEKAKLYSRFPGNYGDTVGIIGAGMIGKLVIEMLRPFHLRTVVFDPFLPDETAEVLGTKKVSLKELFSTSTVVSNHLANKAETRGMLRGTHFASMPPYSTFLNTGRGAQVVEEELAKVLSDRPDIYAVLDVTAPEPPAEGHPFYSLPNCILTPHIAGSLGKEVHRMAEYMREAYLSHVSHQPSPTNVTIEMLATMA